MEIEGAVAVLEAAIGRAPAGSRRHDALVLRLQRIRDEFGIVPEPPMIPVSWQPSSEMTDASAALSPGALETLSFDLPDASRPSDVEVAEQIALEWQEERLDEEA